MQLTATSIRSVSVAAREGGEGRERGGVAVEEEGKEVERERASLTMQKKFPKREKFRERGGKRGKNVEEKKRTDQLFFLTS